MNLPRKPRADKTVGAIEREVKKNYRLPEDVTVKIVRNDNTRKIRKDAKSGNL